MKKLISILVFSFVCLHAQMLWVTPKGLALVKDSIHHQSLTNDYYSNYKGKYQDEISNDRNWMKKNEGKYLLPTIEEDSFIVLKIQDLWGAVRIDGVEKATFGFGKPIDFFKKGYNYGFQNIGSLLTYQLSGEGSAYDGNYRIKNIAGEVLVNYSQLIDRYKTGFLLLGKSPDKCGMINTNMDTIVPFIYSCASWDAKNFGFSDRGFVALRNAENKCGVMNYKGRTVMPFSYDYIDDLVFPTALIQKDGKYGLLSNLDLRIKVPIRYDDIQCSSNANMGKYFGAFAKDSTGYDVYDSAFTRIGHYHFDELGYSFDNPQLVVVKKNGLFGLYDFLRDKYAYAPRYREEYFLCSVDCEKDGLQVLYIQDSCYLINPNGKLEHQFAGQEISSLYANYYRLTLASGRIQVLKNYKPFLTDVFHHVLAIADEENQRMKYMAALKDDLYGVFDTTGKQVLPYAYRDVEWLDAYQDAYFISVLDTSGWWCLDESLRKINPVPFDMDPTILHLGDQKNNGKRVVQIKGKTGLFDFIKKEFLVEPIYEQYKEVIFDQANWDSSPGYHCFVLNHQIKCLDESFNQVMVLEGDELLSTDNKDVLILKNNNVSYLVNAKDGKKISGECDSLEPIKESYGLFLIKSKGKFGCMDANGKIVVPAKYTSACWVGDLMLGAVMAFSKGNQVDYMDNTGKINRTEKLKGGWQCYN